MNGQFFQEFVIGKRIISKLVNWIKQFLNFLSGFETKNWNEGTLAVLVRKTQVV